jgi:hypothetical protein
MGSSAAVHRPACWVRCCKRLLSFAAIPSLCSERRWCWLDLDSWFRSLHLTNRKNPSEQLLKALAHLYCELMQALPPGDMGFPILGELDSQKGRGSIASRWYSRVWRARATPSLKR